MHFHWLLIFVSGGCICVSVCLMSFVQQSTRVIKPINFHNPFKCVSYVILSSLPDLSFPICKMELKVPIWFYEDEMRLYWYVVSVSEFQLLLLSSIIFKNVIHSLDICFL